MIWACTILLFAAGCLFGASFLKDGFFSVSAFTDFFEVVSAVATSVGVCVAIYGLKSWRDQHKFAADHELARRLLVKVLAYRDVLKAARNPAIFGGEMDFPGRQEMEKHNPDAARFNGIQEAYSKRTGKYIAIRSETQPILTEAEAVWGVEVVNLIEPLFKLGHEYTMCIYKYIRSIDPELRHDSGVYLRLYNEVSDIHYDLSSEKDGPDDFTIRIDSVVDEIKACLGNKLIR